MSEALKIAIGFQNCEGCMLDHECKECPDKTLNYCMDIAQKRIEERRNAKTE